MPHLLHLEHVEDMIFDGNYIQAYDVLSALSDRLMGDKSVKGLKLSEKFDGAPAVVFGINPENGKYFVGTKSVFNKRLPKIAYTSEDIHKFYGDKPELEQKLKMLREVLQDNYPVGVWQGDFMWTPDSITIDQVGIHFTPNTVTYHQTLDHPTAPSMSSKGIGMCLHTKYVNGKTLSEMLATPVDYMDLNLFRMFNTDCYFIDPSINLDLVVVIDEDWKEHVNSIMNHLDAPDVRNTARAAFAITVDHAKHLRMFVNYCIRIGEVDPGLEMYEIFLNNRGEDEMLENLIKNRDAFAIVFDIHHMMSVVKRMIVGALQIANQYITSVDSNLVKGEGYVVDYYGSMYKLVDRLEFSRLNFMNKRFEKA